MTVQVQLGQAIDPLAGRDVGDWAAAATAAARLTELEDKMFAIEARIANGEAAWAEDEAAGLVADYTRDPWAHKALFERLMAERAEVFVAIGEVSPWP